MNFTKAAAKVRPILENNPVARDNDNILIAEVWNREIENLPGDVAYDCGVIDLLKYGMLENPETIVRARRRLQEKNACLRGEKWIPRHRVQQEAYKEISSI